MSHCSSYTYGPITCPLTLYWAAFYIFLRIAILVIFPLTQNGYFVLVVGILLVPTASLLLVVRPYRRNVYNAIDAVMFLAFILSCFSACGFLLTVFDRRYEAFVNIMFGIGVVCPPIYANLLLIKTTTPNNLFTTTRTCFTKFYEEKRRDYREVKALKSLYSGNLITEENPRIYNCSVEGMHITIILYSITNKMLLHGKKSCYYWV